MGPEDDPNAATESLGDYAGLGGRALTSAIVAREVPPLCHPLGADNKLVIAPGLLSGTTAAISGRLSVGCKSPLTGSIKEANAGSGWAPAVARLGLKAIVVEGQPKEKGAFWTVCLSWEDDKPKVEFAPTEEQYVGKDLYEVLYQSYEQGFDLPVDFGLEQASDPPRDRFGTVLAIQVSQAGDNTLRRRQLGRDLRRLRDRFGALHRAHRDMGFTSLHRNDLQVLRHACLP